MKSVFVIMCVLLGSIPCSYVYAQSYHAHFQPFEPRSGDIFDQDFYPADSFSVSQIKRVLGETVVIVTLLHYDFMRPEDFKGEENLFFQIWLEQRKAGKLIRSQYFGYEAGENYYEILNEQIHPEYFLFSSQYEFTGTLYIIDDNAVWHTIEGKWFCFDQTQRLIYSFVPEECGGCTIGKFNLETQEMVTKEWNGRGTAWSEYPHNVWSNLMFGDDERIEWNEKDE